MERKNIMNICFEECVNLGTQLKVNRARRGYTVEELSRKSGVSVSAINYWESGKGSNMRLGITIKLAEALDIALEELIVERKVVV